MHIYYDHIHHESIYLGVIKVWQRYCPIHAPICTELLAAVHVSI